MANTDTDTKTPIDIALARMEARQRAAEGEAEEQDTAPQPPPQQVQISVAAMLEGLLAPGKEYNANHLLAGLGRIQMLDTQVFHMGIPELCSALDFLIRTWNRTSRYKPAEYAPPVPVPAAPSVSGTPTDD